MKRISATREGRKLSLILAAAILTTEPPVDPPANNDPPTDPPADDLSTIFTPEEVTAKKESLAAAQAEETRRAALTDDQRKAEDDQKAAEDLLNGVPEKYEFKAPEGITLDPVMVEKFAPIAKELGLTQSKAQTLIDLAAEMQQRTMDGVFEMHEQRKVTWLEEAKKDPEIGADVSGKPEDSVALRAFNTIAQGSPGLKSMVDELGIGNHPEFLRVFYKIGKNMREDTFEGGGGNRDDTAKTVAERAGTLFNHPSRSK
jgi:hypothetical protein